MAEELGRVTGRELKENKDSEKKSLLLQVEFDELEDTQTVELFNVGEQFNPPDDARVLAINLGSNATKIALVIDDGFEPDVEIGEREIYSIADGEKKAKIKWLADGTLQLNDGEDHAVRYSELESAFNALRDDFNNFVTQVFNLHTQPISGAAAGVPVTPGTPSAANVTAAKIDNVRVP